MVDGLRRLEYRGYDSAGVAVVADGELCTSQAGRQAGQPRDGCWAPRPARRRHDRHRAHPLGHPRRAHRPQRPPARRRQRPRRGDPQRHHRELRRAARRARGAGVTSSLATPTPRSSPTCSSSSAAPRSGERPGRGDAAGLPAAGRRVHPASPSTRDAPDVVVGARRNSPLVVGRGDGENFLASDVSAFIEHTREAIELGQDQVVELSRDGVAVTDFDGDPAEGDELPRRLGRRRPPRRAATTTSCSRRSPSSRRPSPTRCSAASAPTACCSWTRCGSPTTELREIDKIIIIACGTAFHAGPGREVRHRALDPDPVRGRAGQRVPLPRPGRSTRDTLVVAITPVRRDHGHPDGAAARARAAAPGCWRSATPTARRSRASPTRCSTPTPGPEVARRLDQGASSPSSSPATWSALYLAQVRGTKFGDEIAAVVDELARDAGQGRRGAGRRWSRCAALAATLARRAVGAVPRPARGLPGRAGGRAQAQGAGLHARRGLRGRRAQARPDRADRGRRCR